MQTQRLRCFLRHCRSFCDSARLASSYELILTGPEGHEITFPSDWLHDNRPEAFNIATFQRTSDSFGNQRTYTRPMLHSVSLSNDSLVVNWGPDSRVSTFDLAWLKFQMELNVLPTKTTTQPSCPLHAPTSCQLWDSKTLEMLPKSSFPEVMENELSCLEYLEKLDKYGFCLLSNCPVHADNRRLAQEVCEGIAAISANYVRNSVFGGFWEFEAGYEHADTAYTDHALPSHVDSCYCYDPPGLQMLHCIELNCTGGETTLVDGFSAAEELHRDEPEYFDTLRTQLLSFTYRDDGKDILLRNATPVLVQGDLGGLCQVRYNDCDRDPFRLDAPLALYEAWNRFSYHIKKPSARVTFQLTPGNVLIFNNWRILHGRTEFQGKRRVVGCYMNMEDFRSRLRVLRKRHRPADTEGSAGRAAHL